MAPRLRSARLSVDEPPSTIGSCATEKHARPPAMASGHKPGTDGRHAQEVPCQPLDGSVAVAGLQGASRTKTTTWGAGLHGGGGQGADHDGEPPRGTGLGRGAQTA
ncbi:hypothetical protein ZWY2020_043872 [Hordeum vulgare]|nr:hypothetical protein ZWY2020_043872 [Hordeum vulgare]